MKLNFNLKSSLCALMLLAGMSACTSETEILNNADDGQLSAQSGIHFVIQTPSSDAIVSRATQTVVGEDAENKIRKMSLYIFALNDNAADADENYTLLKKTEDIDLSSLGNGQLTYTEPITSDMIGKKVKMLLVANDKVTSATKGTTKLNDFKKSEATAVATSDGSADVISGDIFSGTNSSNATGLVMSAVAYSGDTEGQDEAVTLTPLGVDMKANFQRIVARIDLIHNIPNMTLKSVKVLNAASKGYLFKQGTTDAPTDATPVTLLPTSASGVKGLAYQPKSGNETDAEVIAKNTLKHVFYLYEKTNNGDDNCVTVEISYTLKMGNWDKDGTVQVKFKKSQTDGSGYVNTARNTLYTIKMGDGKEATDVNNVTTLTVKDWDQEQETDESFTPNEDTHSEVITDLTQAEIGDYYMSDGTLRKSNYKFMESEKSQVIGVVFQTYKAAPGRFGDAEKNALHDKGVDTPHGLVMAVKEANNGIGCAWKNTADDEKGLDNMAFLSDAYSDINGLSNYNKVKDNDESFSNHPAFKAILDFEVLAPQSSTGWFLPSSGQWWDCVANLGKMDSYLSSKQSDSQNEYWNWYYAESGSDSNSTYINKEQGYVQNQINSYLTLLGSNADQIKNSVYWSSSEHSSTLARYVAFDSKAFSIDCSGGNKMLERYVRPVLAF